MSPMLRAKCETNQLSRHQLPEHIVLAKNEYDWGQLAWTMVFRIPQEPPKMKLPDRPKRVNELSNVQVSQPLWVQCDLTARQLVQNLAFYTIKNLMSPPIHWQKCFATFDLRPSSQLLVSNWKKYPIKFHWLRGYSFGNGGQVRLDRNKLTAIAKAK